MLLCVVVWNKKAQALVYVVFSVRVRVTYSYVIIRSYAHIRATNIVFYLH